MPLRRWLPDAARLQAGERCRSVKRNGCNGAERQKKVPAMHLIVACGPLPLAGCSPTGT